MNFACHQCERRYTIADEKVRGRTLKVRCKSCQAIIDVRGAPEPEEESTRALSREDLELLRAAEREAAAPAAAPAVWFIMVRGAQQGPLTQAELDEARARGDFTARTFCWMDGMADWKRAAEIPELAAAFPAPAPKVAPGISAVPPTPAPPATPVVKQRSAAPAATSRSGAPAGGGSVPTPKSSGPQLAGLFDDMDLTQIKVRKPAPEAPAPRKAAPPRSEAGRSDPFAEVADLEAIAAAPPGEDTQFFIAQAGTTRRAPAWKIAAFGLGAIAVPIALLFVLSVTNVVPLHVKRVDAATGESVEAPLFSGEGVAGLKERMLGSGQKRSDAAAVVSVPAASSPTPQRKPATQHAATDTSGIAEAAALYALDEKQDVGPVARKASAVSAADSSGSDGPPPENIARVVGDRQAAFQSCVEQELRRNPSFRGGKVGLTVTVGSSGAVKGAGFESGGLERERVGECLLTTARKMIFAGFSGDDVQLVIPLVLTRGN